MHQSCLLHVSMADGPPCILILAELSQFPRVLYSLSLACSAVLHRPNLLQHGSQSRPSGVRFHLVLQTQHSICIVTNNRKNRHIQTSPFSLSPPSFFFLRVCSGKRPITPSSAPKSRSGRLSYSKEEEALNRSALDSEKERLVCSTPKENVFSCRVLFGVTPSRSLRLPLLSSSARCL